MADNKRNNIVEKLGPHAGLVLCTSGSSGKPKYVLLDFHKLLKKYDKPRPPLRIIQFMSLDHIGGINTMLYVTFYGEKLIRPKSTSVADVCQAIQDEKADTLPTTPTFLRLLVLSGLWKDFDLSSLKTITYGTEKMPQTTLDQLNKIFPNVKLHQTYGSTEIGIMRSKSREAGSLWVKVGGEGYQTRVREGLLEVKADSAMVGYLNAPQPFTDDGWYMTGDAVEQDGEWLKILGRTNDIINVGGEKVYPAEVEDALEALPGVMHATVTGEGNQIMGQIVKAVVQLSTGENKFEFTSRMTQALTGKLERYKIPLRVELADNLVSDRGKKLRNV
jgi:acyl-coenzyme A synthetase/AMP-(fatty) acid ligase